MKKKNSILILCVLAFFLFFSKTSYSQVDDPTIITELSTTVEETSGLLFYNSKLWTHNDSGNEASLYCVDTLDGSVIVVKPIGNSTNNDWEDICSDENYAYIADIGNNSGQNSDFKIYRISLEDIDSDALDIINADIITFNYNSEYYPEAKKNSKNDTDFDCEAMIAYGDSLYLFSKNWNNHKTYLYSIPKTPGNYVAERLDTLDVSGLICGADYCQETHSLVLIGYVYGIPAPSLLVILSNFEGTRFFRGDVLRKELPLDGYQTEGIIYRDQNTLWISNEDFLGHNPAIHEIKLNNSYISQAGSTSLSVSLFPNPTDSSVSIMFPEKGKYKLKISDLNGNQLKKTSVKIMNSELTYKIDVSSFKPGKYFICITNPNSSYRLSFIKI